MAQFFVSYARIDIVLAEQIIEVLRQRYRHANVWYDHELHNRGGEYWWEEILDAIGEADIFVYLLSKESVESPYCQAEFEEAQRLKKRLIFIQIRDRTPLPATIASRQYADMSKDIGNLKTWTSLYNSIDHQINKIPKHRPRPLKPERTPRPQQSESSQVRPTDAPAETTPKLEPITFDEVRDPARPPRPTWLRYVAIIAGVVLIGVLIVGLLIASSDSHRDTVTPTDAGSAIARVTTETPTDTLTPTLSGFQQLQTTEAELTQAAVTQAAFNLIATGQFISNSTATAQQLDATETAAFTTLVALSATPTHTSTATNTSTPTATPSPIRLTPILTTTPLAGSFAIELLDNDLSTFLGSPIGGGVKTEIEAAYQEFEYGFMLFRSSFPPEQSIFVLYPGGLYEAFPNLWQWGVDDPISEDVGPPEDLFQPVNGFGVIWLDHRQVRQHLGWATSCESSIDILIQTFTNGVILRLDAPRRFTYIELECGDRNQFTGKTFVFLYRPQNSTSGTWIKLHD